MATLELDGITRSFGALRAVDDVSLSIPEGELVCFLGPSGCGKTTLLRLIAGLETPGAGRIRVDGEDITGLPAHRRNFGMVFQSLALFPHLNVADNVTYGLAVRGQSRDERRRRAAELLELVRLPDVADRQISQLSGGQRQRVAIARALALEPRLFLLDEPLSALDAKLREDMQLELRLLQQRLGITTIVVTHDQREAMTMADRVVVMRDGVVQQYGSPLDIYRRPANTFVAGFIGTSNLLEAEPDGGGRLKVGDVSFTVANEEAAKDARGPVTISVRPEDVTLRAGTEAGPNRLCGTVRFVRDVGVSIETFIECGGAEIVSHAAPRERHSLRQGDAVTAEFPADHCIALPGRMQ